LIIDYCHYYAITPRHYAITPLRHADIDYADIIDIDTIILPRHYFHYY
jgi:hypothetical protein